ncbi:MAG: dephospho-CoA kinase [Actinomycetota bacterium]|jgi:dephospho-CoA kinase|nr:dephospho-CoA kinase [Actinomycetota bacterium]
MLLVGLTGGIGAGKSTFAALLAERGAQIVDADLLGRDALRPGEEAWKGVVEQFGDEILAAGSMEVDRKRLAAIVFHDAKQRIALNAIVHPVILRRIADTLDTLRASDEIVVLDAALIVETGLDKDLDLVIVVTAGESARESRLVAGRRMSRADIKARIAAQAAEADLLERADEVVPNNGTLQQLAVEADRVWDRLLELRDSK